MAQLPSANLYNTAEELESAIQAPTTKKEKEQKSFNQIASEISASVNYMHTVRPLTPMLLSMPLSTTNVDALKPLKPLFNKKEQSNATTRNLDKVAQGIEMDQYFINYLQTKTSDLIEVTNSDLLAHKVDERPVTASKLELETNGIKPATARVIEEKVDGKELPKKYWTFGWNGVLHFTQSYISANWHKGGNSNLNLFNKHLFFANYKKDRLAWTNELEWRLSVFTSAADTVGKYRVADDLLRFHTNIGIESSFMKNLYYTLDWEVKTQLFKMREENKSEYLSALFSPITSMVGLGAKYVYDWKSEAHYGRKLHFEVNLSPLAYDFRWAMNKDIDLARHGFQDGKNIYSAIGSMIRANLDYHITQSIQWQSRFLFNTSYKRVEAEWENGLIFSINKYLSTRFNLALRYDDAVQLQDTFWKRLQINQLLSFGIEVNFTR